MSRQRKMMSQHSSLLLEGFIIAIEISVSRQRITIKEEPVSRQSFSMSRQKVLDVGAFYVATGNGHNKGSTVATELAKVRRNYVAIKQFYVMIEFVRVGRNYVATEDFWVVTELATIESFFAHDRVGCAKAGAQDSVAPCCVSTEEAMCTR